MQNGFRPVWTELRVHQTFLTPFGPFLLAFIPGMCRCLVKISPTSGSFTSSFTVFPLIYVSLGIASASLTPTLRPPLVSPSDNY